MPLEATWTQLDSELSLFSQNFRKFAAEKPALSSSSQFSLLDECLLEGLLSRAWQSWGIFCRRCVVESCLGSVTSAGNVVLGIPGVTTEAEVSGAARVARHKPNPPYWPAPPNTLLRLEPTWGDVDVLNGLLTRLNPTNAPQLLAAFSTGHASSKALQRIRNGAAHKNHETMAEIQAIGSAYLVFPIAHPTHALFWTAPASGDFLVTQALEEMSDAGAAAVA